MEPLVQIRRDHDYLEKFPMRLSPDALERSGKSASIGGQLITVLSRSKINSQSVELQIFIALCMT